MFAYLLYFNAYLCLSPMTWLVFYWYISNARTLLAMSKCLWFLWKKQRTKEKEREEERREGERKAGRENVREERREVGKKRK